MNEHSLFGTFSLPMDLEFRPLILGVGTVVDEYRWLGTLILVISITLARLPFSLECKPILHHMLALLMCDATDPCSVNTAYEPVFFFKKKKKTVHPISISRGGMSPRALQNELLSVLAQ